MSVLEKNRKFETTKSLSPGQERGFTVNVASTSKRTSNYGIEFGGDTDQG
jgi:hypothetical protein